MRPQRTQVPPQPARGAVTVTVAEDGNRIRVDGDLGFGGVRNIEIQFDPETGLPVRTSFNGYDVQWTLEPASGDRFRVRRLQFDSLRRMADVVFGSASPGSLEQGIVAYEWGGSGSSETLTGVSIDGWDVQLSNWSAAR